MDERDQIYRILGTRSTTDTNQIEKIGKMIPNFKGCVPFNEIKPLKDGDSYIINTQPSCKGGEHWMALVRHGRNYIVWDSFARTLCNTIPVLCKVLNDKVKVININKKPDQMDTENNCGQNSLAWLICYNKYGYDISKQI